LKDFNVISALKLRGGYGGTAGYWSKLSLNTIVLSNTAAQYQFGNVFIDHSHNSNLKWEETTTVNAGLDYGFFNNRITGAVDCIKEPPKIYYYIRKTHLSLGSLTMIITMSELLKIKGLK
jgi:iron complex outermembrane receptor protein